MIHANGQYGVVIHFQSIRVAFQSDKGRRNPGSGTSREFPANDQSRKKLRCTGTLPCNSCNRAGRKCEYNADYNRGKLPTVPISQPPAAPEGNDQQRQLTFAGESAGSPPLPQPPLAPSLNVPASNPRGNNGSSRASPEPHQTDLEGHYVGPSSGVSFLSRAQRKLYNHLSLPLNTPIFTFGDAPLPSCEPNLMILPLRSEADSLVARYFDFAFPTHRFLHQQQIQSWVGQFYDSVLRSETVDHGMRGKWAVVLMVFAQARQSLLDTDRTSNSFLTNRLVLSRNSQLPANTCTFSNRTANDSTVQLISQLLRSNWSPRPVPFA